MSRQALAWSLIIWAHSAAALAKIAPAAFAPVPDGSGAYFTVTPAIRARFSPGRVELLRRNALVTLEFRNALPSSPEGERELAGRLNFLLGDDPGAWRTGLPTFAAIRYRDLYPGIDLLYTVEGGSLKSEFIVAAGADPSRIRVRWIGARSLRLEYGELVAETEDGELRERAPRLYQIEGGIRRLVPGGFRQFEDGDIGFSVGPYEPALALYIDPEIDFSTFLGGSSIDYATSIAVDPSGRVLVAGWTDSTNFPIVAPFRGRGGSVDAFLVRYNAAGTAIEFATYLGGSSDDRALALAVDALGQPVLAGFTASTNFPVQNAAQTSSGGGRDAFLAKLNASGTGFVFSTYLGGAGQDEGRAVTVDAAGNVYMGGATYSTNFPTLNAFQTANAGGQDGFLAKFSPGGSRLYSTLLGGQADDRVNAVAVDGSGQLYATGATASANFPVVSGALQPTSGGGQDAFVVKVSASGSQRMYSTYLGGSGSAPEEGLAIAVDATGSAYVAGVTTSSNFPLAGAFQSLNRGGGGDAFLARLNPAGSALVFSSFYGGGGADYAYAIAVDSAGIVHLAGQTSSINLPMRDPIQATNAGLQDAFVAQVEASGASVIWASYLGGTQADGATAMALDNTGMIHLAGVTQSADFPRQRPIQASHGGLLDSFVARVRGYAAGAPQAVSVSPSSGSGNGGTFQFTYSDPNQHQDIQEVRALWSSSLSEAGACSVRYLRADNTLWLRDDSGSAWLGPANPGGSVTLENGQCRLAVASSTVSGAGTTLTLTLAVSFKSIFGGPKNVYLYAVDVLGLNSGWQQRGSWTVANFAPEALSVSPSSGSGTAQTFEFAFRDGDGHTQLRWVYALIHSTLVQSNGCYLRYTRADNTLWLRSDDGTAWLGPVTPGSSSTLENNQCRLLASASAASGSGLNLTVTARFEFKGGFAGAKNVWLNAIDTTNQTSNWQLRGAWTVAGFLPEAVSVTPSSGSGNSQTFRFLFRDFDGAADLQWVFALFDTALSGANACYLRFRRSENALWLRNDANNNWLGPVTVGSSGTVENTQCTLAASGSSAVATGATLQLDVAVTFKSAFVGNKNIYLYATDNGGQVSGWHQRGTWTVPGVAPEAISVVPSSGAGASQTFRFTFRDGDGFAQLRFVHGLFHTSITGANACYWRYTLGENTLWLRNDAGTAWLGPMTPGTSATIENSQCRLVGSTSAVSGSATTLNVDVTIQFKTAFAGAKNVYLYAIDAMNLNSDWQLRGTWTVP